MKKQLLIAAVAATMTSVAFADISISGSANIKMGGSDTYNMSDSSALESLSQNMDLEFTGKSGATSVHAHIDVDNTGTATSNINVDKLWMQTAIGSVNVKAGDYSSCTGMVEGIVACGTTGDALGLSTTIGGATVGATLTSGDNTSAKKVFTAKGDIAGMNVAVRYDGDDDTTDTDADNSTLDIAVKGSVAGVDLYVEHMARDLANADATMIAASTEVAGGTVSVASFEADTAGMAMNNGDIRPLGTSLVGDFHTAILGSLATVKDFKGIGFNTSVAGNTVNVVAFDYDTSSVNDMKGTDVVVTRALASGATLTANYGTVETSASADTAVYGAQLSVKF